MSKVYKQEIHKRGISTNKNNKSISLVSRKQKQETTLYSSDCQSERWIIPYIGKDGDKGEFSYAGWSGMDWSRMRDSTCQYLWTSKAPPAQQLHTWKHLPGKLGKPRRGRTTCPLPAALMVAGCWRKPPCLSQGEWVSEMWGCMPWNTMRHSYAMNSMFLHHINRY